LKKLSRYLEYILPKIRKASKVALFLDYDGTITPIVKRPDEALLSPESRKVLQKLKNSKNIIISVVTGRSLKDIKKLVGVKDIYYAGSHGMEIALAKRDYILPGARAVKPLLKTISAEFKDKLKGVKNFKIENKGIVLAFHYRQVDKRHIRRFHSVFKQVTTAYIRSGMIKSARGKKVLEVRPAIDWDKGKYCRYLLNKLSSPAKRILPVYIGDDVTDEAAFKALRGSGITIFVKGEKKSSCAEYYLDSPAAVLHFLKMLVD
jgi:trehalose-phosphatase